jgi:hypothetical protein
MDKPLLVHNQLKDATIMTILLVLLMLDARTGTLTPLLSKLMPQIQPLEILINTTSLMCYSMDMSKTMMQTLNKESTTFTL